MYRAKRTEISLCIVAVILLSSCSLTMSTRVYQQVMTLIYVTEGFVFNSLNIQLLFIFQVLQNFINCYQYVVVVMVLKP